MTQPTREEIEKALHILSIIPPALRQLIGMTVEQRVHWLAEHDAWLAVGVQTGGVPKSGFQRACELGIVSTNAEDAYWIAREKVEQEVAEACRKPSSLAP